MAPTTTFPPLPDIKHFATNKSNRFLVDFEDIIAGHPFVGQRSPAPHNDAQVYFSNGNDEFPTVEGVELAPSVALLGEFKADDVVLADVAKNIPTAQKIFNEVGWK